MTREKKQRTFFKLLLLRGTLVYSIPIYFHSINLEVNQEAIFSGSFGWVVLVFHKPFIHQSTCIRIFTLHGDCKGGFVRAFADIGIGSFPKISHG